MSASSLRRLAGKIIMNRREEMEETVFCIRQDKKSTLKKACY